MQCLLAGLRVDSIGAGDGEVRLPGGGLVQTSRSDMQLQYEYFQQSKALRVTTTKGHDHKQRVTTTKAQPRISEKYITV